MFMDDSAGKNTAYAMLLQDIFCLPCDTSQEIRLEVVVLSGMQLLCETSWYPEILNENIHRSRSLEEVLGVIWAWGRVSDSFPHCFYFTAFPGNLSGDLHCCVEGDLQLLQGLTA